MKLNAILLILALSPLAALSGFAAPEARAAEAVLELTIDGIDPVEGQIGIAIFADAKYPTISTTYASAHHPNFFASWLAPGSLRVHVGKIWQQNGHVVVRSNCCRTSRLRGGSPEGLRWSQPITSRGNYQS